MTRDNKINSKLHVSWWTITALVTIFTSEHVLERCSRITGIDQPSCLEHLISMSRSLYNTENNWHNEHHLIRLSDLFPVTPVTISFIA